MHVPPYTQMPHHPRDQQRHAQHNRRPQRPGPLPLAHIPPILAQCPEGDGDVEDVAEDERREERGDDFLLQRGLGVQVPPCGPEDEEVDGAEEGDGVRELEEGDESGEWEGRVWWEAVWPGGLLVVDLELDKQDDRQCWSNRWSRSCVSRTSLGCRIAPRHPPTVSKGSNHPKISQ